MRENYLPDYLQSRGSDIRLSLDGLRLSSGLKVFRRLKDQSDCTP